MPPDETRVCSATPWEVAQVQDLIRRQAGHVYLEIGSYIGGSLIRYGGSMPAGSTLLAVDLPLAVESLTRLREAVIQSRDDGYECRLFTGDSHSQSLWSEVAGYLGEDLLVDVLFIDGDHSAAGCRRDLDLYVPLVRPGGLVLMHDCGLPDAVRPVSEKVAGVMAGLHAVWRERSAGKRRALIQEWCGYGVWWR